MKKNFLICGVIIFVCLFATKGWCFKKYTNTVGFGEIKALKEQGADFLLINTLSKIEDDAQSIPGSINIPMEAIKEELPKAAGKDKKIIFYCKGPKCHKSHTAAFIAEELGYTNVLVYPGGLPDWVRNGEDLEQRVSYPAADVEVVSPEELNSSLDQYYILDIQDEKSYQKKNVPGSVNIPMYRLDKEFASIPKDKTILLTDKAGKQVLIAGRFLASKGHKNIKRLDGGLHAWLRAGFSSGS